MRRLHLLFRHRRTDELRQAEEQLAAVRERASEVHRLAQSLRAMRERNHFAEIIEDTMRRPRR